MPDVTALSFVIPARNEAAAIRAVVAGCLTFGAARGTPCEVIVVDDASTDDTASLVGQFGDAGGLVRLLRHEVRRGIAVTSHDGLLAAAHDVICYLDGDGQFDAADFGPLLDLLDRADLIVGRRTRRVERGARTWGSRVYNRCTRWAGVPVHDVNCGFRVLTRACVAAAAPRVVSRSSFYFAELTLRVIETGGRVAEAPIPHHPRVGGTPSGAGPRVVVTQFVDLARYLLRARTHRSAQTEARR